MVNFCKGVTFDQRCLLLLALSDLLSRTARLLVALDQFVILGVKSLFSLLALSIALENGFLCFALGFLLLLNLLHSMGFCHRRQGA